MKIQLSDLKLDQFWKKIRRGVLYMLYLLGFLLLQNVIFSHISPLGVRAMFMPALVVAVALFEGGSVGGYFGLAAGIVCDLYFAGQSVLFTVLFPVMGFTVGLLTDFYLNRRFFSYAVLAVLALFISAFAQMFALLFYYGQSSWALWRSAILQTLWSIPFIFPAYYICKIFPWKAEGTAPSPY
ncbi:MAG: rod shape-determining protein MreD [Oscillospiraceae bacterium]|nr:rod shape-determining protein MreD [Oscillospiraceae bacterium]